MTSRAGVAGFCDPRFRAVREALEENLADAAELGESVSIVVEGKVVVDLRGGYADATRTRPWAEDTLVCMFSVGKPIAILPVLMLAERGAIDLDQPVARYWPQFGQAGKESIRVRELIAHLAAIPGALKAKTGDAYDWEKMVRAIELQEPLWEPGTKGCYHTFTMGHLAGELVRRVTGKTLGRFVQDEICRPLGVDFHFGVSVADQRRCATIVEAEGVPPMSVIRDRSTLLGQCWAALPVSERKEDFNTAAWRGAEIPALNGHGTARGVARFFSALACGGALEGSRIVSEATIAYAATEAWRTTDVFGIPNRMSNAGWMLQDEAARLPYNGNPRAFGHRGLGGALAFGDPDRKLGFCFSGNRMAPTPTYVQRLLAATRSSI